MNKYIRWFNQNLREIIKYLVIIILALIGLWTLNYFAHISNEKKIVLSDDLEKIGDIYQRDYDAIQDEKKDSSIYKEETAIIENFLEYCNTQQIDKAYELLTDECKELLYPEVDIFKVQYIDKNFSQKKNYDYKVWTGNTYIIEIREDIMATGTYSESFYTEDYYTIDNEKININGYIGRKQYNKSYVKDKMELMVESIDQFMDYAICNIKFINSNLCEIILDTKEKSGGIELVDNNDIKYNYANYELTKEDLNINKRQTKILQLKFNVSYIANLDFKQLNFNDITEKSELDENQYLKWGEIKIEF